MKSFIIIILILIPNGCCTVADENALRTDHSKENKIYKNSNGFFLQNLF
jgi:hypothetical protein